MARRPSVAKAAIRVARANAGGNVSSASRLFDGMFWRCFFPPHPMYTLAEALRDSSTTFSPSDYSHMISSYLPSKLFSTYLRESGHDVNHALKRIGHYKAVERVEEARRVLEVGVADIRQSQGQSSSSGSAPLNPEILLHNAYFQVLLSGGFDATSRIPWLVRALSTGPLAPTLATYVLLLRAHGLLGDIQAATRLSAWVLANHAANLRGPQLHGALMDSFLEVGQPRAALEIFRDMVVRGAPTPSPGCVGGAVRAAQGSARPHLLLGLPGALLRCGIPRSALDPVCLDVLDDTREDLAYAPWEAGKQFFDRERALDEPGKYVYSVGGRGGWEQLLTFQDRQHIAVTSGEDENEVDEEVSSLAAKASKQQDFSDSVIVSRVGGNKHFAPFLQTGKFPGEDPDVLVLCWSNSTCRKAPPACRLRLVWVARDRVTITRQRTRWLAGE